MPDDAGSDRDFWHMAAPQNSCDDRAMDERARLIRISGTLAWLAVAVPVAISGANSMTRLAVWSVAFLAFGTAHFFATRGPRPPLALLLIQVAAVLGMVLTLCDGFEGTLLVIVAMQLGGLLPRRRAIAWITIQTLLLAVAITIHWSSRPAMLLTPPYFGFQLLALLAFEAMARESAARRELADANAELLAIQTVLADSSRMAERLRISRELHDAIGHHLTALSLNLEAALQRATGDIHERLATAQSLARTLLADIREIVAATELEKGVDIGRAIATLAAGVPRPQVHLQIAEHVRVDDPDSARTVIRCAQEIVTNAARHSGAENLWIVIDVESGAIRIRARDDGHGAATVHDGFGLRAMRSRVEGAGGKLHVESAPGAGFEVTALVPVTS